MRECATRMLSRAKESGLVDNITTAEHNVQLALGLTSGDSEKRKKALDEILGQKQSEGELPSKEEQERIKKAQHDASPLKPLEDLINWIMKQWEEWILPTLKVLKELIDDILPLFKTTLDKLPEALNIIREDLVLPYLNACKDWKKHAAKVSDDLRHGVKAAAIDKPGMPYFSGPNLDMQEVTALSTALSIGFVRDMVAGMVAPLLMEQYQQNTQRGFYDNLAMFKWLLSIGGAGPNLVGMAQDIVSMGRRVGRATGGLAGALADAPDMAAEVPDWFLEHTTPKIDVATGKTDYYLY